MKQGEIAADGTPAGLIDAVCGSNLEDVYMHYFSEVM